MRAAWPGLAACTFVVGLLSACGFQLRQAPDLPAQMRTIYISGGSGDSATLVRNLRRELTTGSSRVVDDANQATAYLKIDNVSENSTLLAISSQGLPLEYKVFYQVEFSLIVGNAVLVEPQTLVLTRTYNYNISNAIGNQQQAQELFNDMAVNMAQLITFRIQAAAKAAMQRPVSAPVPARATLPAPAAATGSTTH